MSFEEWYDQHFGSADPNVVKAGNIDLGDRPAVYNDDGTVSTERSFSIGDEYGRETLLPQVVDGKMLSKKDAIKHYRETGEHLGIYKDIPTANAYADAIHSRTPRLDTPDTFPVGNAMQSIRDLPGWAAYRMYRGATRNDLPGEGPSAREQEAAGVIPPPYQRGSFSVDNARANLRDIKNAILPPGFSAQRGLDSALAPAKWLFNEVRQGVLPDEAIEEIKRDPYSVNSLGAYLNAAISLSGGEGGREVPPGPRPVPRRVWDMWKPTDHPGIKIDELGNGYEATGTHYDKNTGESHITVKPIEPPKPPGDVSDAGFGEVWHDNPFQKFLKEQYPEGTSGQFKDPETLPPGELSKGTTPPPLNEPTLKVAWEWWDGLQKGDITREQYDAAMDAIRKGEMPPLPGQPSKPFEPMPEAGSSLWDEWAKKHGGQKPDFGPPEAPPPAPEPMPPDKPEGYWGNLNDPKYWDRKDSGPLTGQAWADVYATPDVEFTVGPKGPDDLTPYNPRNPPNLPPPGVDPLDSMLSDWAKYMDEKGIDYGQNEPPPVDPGVQKDFDHIEEWWRKMQQNKNRFNWKPPEHGGNNL